MNAHDRASEQLPYPQLAKRVEVLEERMRARFCAIAIIGPVLAEPPNALLDMLSVYRDRHLPQPGEEGAPRWSDVVIANEVNAIINIFEAQTFAGPRVIKGGIS